jgi:hypothetical protein
MSVIPDDVTYDPPQLVMFLTGSVTRMLFTASILQAVLNFNGLVLNKAFQFMRYVYMPGLPNITLVYTSPL